MTGFIVWSSEQLAAFRKVHHGAFLDNHLVDHAAYDKWLETEFNQQWEESR